MRKPILLVGCVVFFNIMGAGEADADCVGGPVFPEPIIAVDNNTFIWSTAVDVDYLKGNLVSLATYTSSLRGRLTQATMLDMTRDTPAPGQGMFYLVKLTGPACGSWQSSADAEPERDLAIEPPCSEVAPTDEQIQAAIDAGLQVAPNPWSDPTDAQRFFEFTQHALGCTFEVFEPTPITSASLESPPKWDPSKYYCTLCPFSRCPSFTENVPAGPCLNRACFDHDSCYFTNCAGGICAFSQQTVNIGCDHPLVLDACDSSACLQQDGLFWRWSNKFICRMTFAFTAAQTANPLPECADPPCNNPGEVCVQSSGMCCGPPSAEVCDGIDNDCDGTVDAFATTWWPAEGNANDAVGTNHGALVNGTSFEAGALGQAFHFDGTDDYVEFGDVLNQVTVPFTFEAWIKTTGVPGFQGIFWSDDRPIGVAGYFGFWVLLRDDDRLTVSYGDGGTCGCPDDRRTKTSNGTIPLNQWVHIAAVVRGAVDMSLYINGVDAAGAYSGTGGNMIHNGWSARLGVTGQYLLTGNLDETAIHGRALTQLEIQAIVASGHPTCP